MPHGDIPVGLLCGRFYFVCMDQRQEICSPKGIRVPDPILLKPGYKWLKNDNTANMRDPIRLVCDFEACCHF